MKDLFPDDRPREKLSRHGVCALGDNELVALVIGHGFRRGGAMAVANDVLTAHGGLHGLTRSTCDDLMRTPGIGHAHAARIVAALEMGRRTPVSYTHLRAHETRHDLVCRLLLEK